MTPRLHAASRALLVAPDDPAVQAEVEAALREDAATRAGCDMCPVDLYIFAPLVGLLLPSWEGGTGILACGYADIVCAPEGVRVRQALPRNGGDPVPARDFVRAEVIAARLRGLYPQARRGAA